MVTKKSRYINLEGGWEPRSPKNGLHFIPQTPIVQLSRAKRARLNRQPTGVLLQGGGGTRRFPNVAAQRIISALLSGVSLLLVFLGIFNIFGRNRGEPVGSS